MKKVYLTKAHTIGENKAARTIHAGEHHVADEVAEALRDKPGVKVFDTKVFDTKAAKPSNEKK